MLGEEAKHLHCNKLPVSDTVAIDMKKHTEDHRQNNTSLPQFAFAGILTDHYYHNAS